MSLTIPIIIMLFIYVLACLFLIMVILIQSGDKGGGLSSLGSSNQGLSDALGATGAEKTLNAWTTASAIAFIVLAIGLSWSISSQAQTSEQILPDQAPSSLLGSEAPATGAIPGAAGGTTVLDPSQFQMQSPDGMQIQNMTITQPGAPAVDGAAPVPPAQPPAQAPAPAAGAPQP